MPTTSSSLIEIDIGSTAYQVETTESKLSLNIEEKDDKNTLLASQEMILDISQLAKIETALGQASRLYYLGYMTLLPQSKTLSEYQIDSLSAAIATFQDDLGVEATGIADKATQSFLNTIFGV